MELTAVSFTQKELYQASTEGMKLFVSCRGETVVWKASYLDFTRHNEQDICVRDDVDFFGDDCSYETKEIESEGFKEEGFTYTEHFPECRKDELLTALELLENFKPANHPLLEGAFECPLFSYSDRYKFRPVSWEDVDWEKSPTLKNFIFSLKDWLDGQSQDNDDF
jgi:hypothetical protein